jgi:general secretion pathway protein J
MNSRGLTKGFTLLELLIAISIFSVMATLAYGGVKLVIDGSMHIEKSADGLASLQRTFLFIQQDLQQAVPRGARDEFGDQEGALISGTDDKLLQLTRGGVNGGLMGGADLRRVEYHLVDGRLDRLVWPVLDRVQDVTASRLRLIEGVQGIDIRFVGYEGTDWQGSWSVESTSEKEILPRAVEVIITTEQYGAVSRIFVVGS